MPNVPPDRTITPAHSAQGVKMRRAGWALGSKNQVICHVMHWSQMPNAHARALQRSRLPAAQMKWLNSIWQNAPSLRAAIHAQSQSDSLLLLAHNPGIAEVASTMVKTPPDHPAFYTYPPGATLVLNYDPQGGTAQLVDFTTPADLSR